jgi:hypothetical protein
METVSLVPIVSLVRIVSLVPRDVVNLILEFQGYHKFRNGKYMKQISPEDERYEIIRKKPWNTCYYTNQHGNFYRSTFYRVIQKKHHKIIIHSIDYGGKLHWYMNVLFFDILHNQTVLWKKCKNKSIHYIHHV